MDDVAPVLVMMILFAIPMVAIVGGIVSGIVKTAGRQRLMELAQKERIAAIERGIDPARLPPLPALAEDSSSTAAYGPGQALRRSHGLMIGGLITLAIGISLGILAKAMEPNGNQWVVGLVPGSVGCALLVSAWLVRPRGNGTGPAA
jgi:hypothetical protein